ncbi:hypothetical protein DFP81_11075 [Marinomonas pollencensis]|uniref:Uncharacterized protein n=1 Tax=Marinomonas pollencensis TaxID=491954 RepID=A0A3E0DHI7_9GAMM|nr:hypothetical protein DFP81_11075 [Marinomonas pollencensis]
MNHAYSSPKALFKHIYGGTLSIDEKKAFSSIKGACVVGSFHAVVK